MTSHPESRTDYSVWVEGAPEPAATAGSSGPLAGLRLAVKDLFDVKGRVTGAGNPDWRGEQAPAGQDASAVAALRAAGACFVGKTQTDELAYSLNGANMHYGTPLNPAAPDRLPGGSSSGSAVAVARGEADIGLGTDTGGSIRVPASYNGLFGLRPSHGVMATEGLVPLAPPFDTVGWLCRDFATLGAVAETLLPGAPVEAGSDLQLLLPEGAPAELAHRMTRYLPERPTGSIGLTQAWLSHVSQTFRVLQGRAIWRTHGDWITRRQPRFAEDIAKRFQWCATLGEADERAAERAREQIIEQLRGWSDDGARLLVMPTTPGAAPLLTLSGDELAHYREQLMGLTALAGLWRAPQLSLPWLTDDREADHPPWGMSLLGAPGQDRRLLACAGQEGRR